MPIQEICPRLSTSSTLKVNLTPPISTPPPSTFRALRTAIRPAQRAVAAARRAASPAPRIRPESTSSNAKRNLKTALEPFPTPKNPSNTPHCDTPHVVKIAKKSSLSQPHVEADTGSNAVSQPPRHPASGIYRRSRRPTHAVAPNPHGRSYPISRFSIISIAPPVAAALTCGTRGAAVWECGKPPADKYVFHPNPQLAAWCHRVIQQKRSEMKSHSFRTLALDRPSVLLP